MFNEDVARHHQEFLDRRRKVRFDEIEDDLLARRTRAEHEAWLREVEGIDLTLTFLRQKRQETKRLARIAPVDLGMPVITAPR